jgi:hypothetical protein
LLLILCYLLTYTDVSLLHILMYIWPLKLNKHEKKLMGVSRMDIPDTDNTGNNTQNENKQNKQLNTKN